MYTQQINHNSKAEASYSQDASAFELSLSYTKILTSWVEISSSAFDHNIATYKTIIGTNTILGLVIKGNAYGHGMREIAYLANRNNAIQYFCVAHLAEAVQLRSYSVIKPIVVLSKTYADFDVAVELNIDLMADDCNTLQEMNLVALKLKKKINVHIKVDTGLSRFGCYVEQVPFLIEYAHHLTNINLIGIYSHFSESYKTNSPFTLQQKNLFYSLIEKYASSFLLRHIANTADAITAAHPLTNMVRIGAGAYGLMVSEIEKTPLALSTITPIIRWKARIVQIKKVPAKTLVGYDGTFKTDRETLLATIPVGYYDGYKKELSNKASVLVNNCYAPIRGLIGMNHITIDITDISDVTVGTEVLLTGNASEVTPTTLAAHAGCFNPRQITTSINPLLKRIIVE